MDNQVRVLIAKISTKITIRIKVSLINNNGTIVSIISKNGKVQIRTLLWDRFSKSLFDSKESNNKDKGNNSKNNMGLKIAPKDHIEFIRINMVILIMRRFTEKMVLEISTNFIRKIKGHFLTIFLKGLRKCKGKLRRS